MSRRHPDRPPGRAEENLDLDALVQEHFKSIYRAARGAGLDAEKAEDVAQETFATVVEKAWTFEGRSSVRTWLFGILYNKIKEQRRLSSRSQRELSLEENEAGDGDEPSFGDNGRWSAPPRSPLAEFEASEVRAILSGCMRSAPAAQRMAFVLREIEGLSTEEICEILGVSATNLGVMQFRFRNRVRGCLESQGVR
ncbi:MAG: sigma-70 family RNA polymerase sigma factor [Acidobacteriota bacterium]